jgi:hypothetical protein
VMIGVVIPKYEKGVMKQTMTRYHANTEYNTTMEKTMEKGNGRWRIFAKKKNEMRSVWISMSAE